MARLYYRQVNADYRLGKVIIGKDKTRLGSTRLD
jgi:hypothetical protein